MLGRCSVLESALASSLSGTRSIHRSRSASLAFRIQTGCRRSVYTVRKSALSQCREAQRQLTMGWQLDPEHRVAPSVPILDSIFDDADMYLRPTDTLASRNWAFATPQTHFAATPSDIKGAHALFVQSLFKSRKLIRQCKARLEVPNMLTLLYFPPWHPLAQGRKSRPALAVLPMQGAPFNGNTPALKLKVRESQRSRNPLDYAVWRQRTARRLRRAMFENWQTVEGARDGLYISMTRRVPTAEQAQSAMATFLQKVADSDHAWADAQHDSVNLSSIQARLVAARISPPNAFTSRSDW